MQLARLHHKAYGDGFPIVILHGLFGMSDNWKTIGRKLSESYKVILVDQRDHGLSDKTDVFGYQLAAHDLKALLDEQAIHQAHLMGHSMGGKTAMTFSQLYPKMISKLIVVDIAPKAYNGGHEHLFEAMIAVDLSKLSSRKDLDTELSKAIPNDSVRYFLMKNLKREKEGGFTWKANFKQLYKSYPTIMGGIEKKIVEHPTLFIKGSNSNYITEVDSDLINQLFLNSTIQNIEGAGHWLHQEKPDELLSIVQNFFKS